MSNFADHQPVIAPPQPGPIEAGMSRDAPTTDPRRPVDAVLVRLCGVKSAGERRWTALCPVHSDRRPSLSISEAQDGRALLKCHAGCTTADVVGALGLAMSDLFPDAGERRRGAASAPHTIVAMYPYTDALGALLYEVVRFHPKDFRARRPAPGGWIWDLRGVQRVLYNLPAVRAAVEARETVFVVEGERDVDALRAIGLTATSNPGGAGKWRHAYSGPLCQADVVILPDNDAPGIAHAHAVARALSGVARRVRILMLPGIPPKGDVSDWLAQGGTKEALLGLVSSDAVEPQPTTGHGPSVGTAVPTLHCSERGAAQHFARQFSAYLRFVPEWGFILYDKGRWRRDRSGQALLSALRLHEEYQAEAERLAKIPGCHGEAVRAAAFAKRLGTAAGVKAVLSLISPMVPSEIHTFDARPYLVNYRDATLDFEAVGQGGPPLCRPPEAADWLSCQAPHPWDEQAKAPAWHAFLESIFPDRHLRDFIQRAAGYSILGTTREQCIFICHGAGANGKSTFLNAITEVLGRDYAHQADPRTFTTARGDDAIRNDLADLRAVRFVAAIETGPRHALDEGLVKQATGGENIRARHLYHEGFEYRPQFKLWLATNHIPRVRGTDDGIWRRIRLIPFNVVIPPALRDKDLPAKLALEAAGILAWLVEGATMYLEDGLDPPDAVEAATAQYRFDEDVVGTFIGECLETRPEARVSAAEAFDAFRKWSGVQSTQHSFGRAMTDKGIRRVTIRGLRYYAGVALREAPQGDASGRPYGNRSPSSGTAQGPARGEDTEDLLTPRSSW